MSSSEPPRKLTKEDFVARVLADQHRRKEEARDRRMKEEEHRYDAFWIMSRNIYNTWKRNRRKGKG